MYVCMYVLYVETCTQKLLCRFKFLHNYYTINKSLVQQKLSSNY